MDFLAKLTGRHEESARPAVFMQLEELVATMQAERQQLEKVLSAVRGDDGAAMPRALGKLEQRVSVLTQQLAAASSRTEQLERATATAEAFQTRMTTLEASLDRAEALTGETVQHAEEIRGERAALQELVSGAENTADSARGAPGRRTADAALRADADAQRRLRAGHRAPGVADG